VEGDELKRSLSALAPFALVVHLFINRAALAQRERPKSVASVPDSVVQLLAVGAEAAGKNCKISATGFFVNEEGYLITNAHVVEDARRCLAMSPEAKILAKLASPAGRAAPAVSCAIVGVDEVHDVAVLRTERRVTEVLGTENAPYARLDSEEPLPGAPVLLTGHPAFAWRPVTQTGQMVRLETLRLGDDRSESSRVMVLNIATQVGNSGSPVYLGTGGVVGIVERRDPWRAAHTVAVSIRYAIELLNRLGVKWQALERE
jgi:S1-C subfamily serine protease